MPLRLVPPRKGWSPYFRVRGTYLGVYIDRSTKTGKRTAANKLLVKWQIEIERGESYLRERSRGVHESGQRAPISHATY
jgi:hypothetical protein